jgi:hypothetical protein
MLFLYGIAVKNASTVIGPGGMAALKEDEVEKKALVPAAALMTSIDQ